MTDYYHRKVPACRPLESKAVVAGSREGVMANIQGLFPLLQGFLEELHPWWENSNYTQTKHIYNCGENQNSKLTTVAQNVYFLLLDMLCIDKKRGFIVNTYPLNRDSLHLHPRLPLTLPPQAQLPRGWVGWQTDVGSLVLASAPNISTQLE